MTTETIMALADAYAAADAEEHHEMEFGNQDRFDAAIYKNQQARATLLTAIEALARDAARYQVIRNAPYSDNHGDLYAMTFEWDGDIPVKLEALDQLADKAIAAQEVKHD